MTGGSTWRRSGARQCGEPLAIRLTAKPLAGPRARSATTRGVLPAAAPELAAGLREGRRAGGDAGDGLADAQGGAAGRAACSP